MLEIRKTVITLDEHDLMELERITTDDEGQEALRFIKKSVYNRILHAQQGRLKSHLDTGGDPTKDFNATA